MHIYSILYIQCVMDQSRLSWQDTIEIDGRNKHVLTRFAVGSMEENRESIAWALRAAFCSVTSMAMVLSWNLLSSVLMGNDYNTFTD